MIFKLNVINYSGMITEQQKYLSSGFKNVGFALLAPFGSILFQWIASKSGAYFEHFWFSMLSLLLGALFMIIGYKFLEEKRQK